MSEETSSVAQPTVGNQEATGAMSPEAQSAPPVPTGADLDWVWQEVRKRVFIKLPFSIMLSDALEHVVPITLDEDTFICGLPAPDYILAGQLQAVQVRNTIESILRHASGRSIHFDVIEGTTLAHWQRIKANRQKATDAVIAMAHQKAELHHYEDLLNQIVTEIRQKVTGSKDRLYPQVRASLLLEIAPLLAQAEEMFFEGEELHDARRALARAIDRVASFLEIPAIILAVEIERYHRDHGRDAVPTGDT